MNSLPTKEQFDQVLKNYGKFLFAIYAMYAIFMVAVMYGDSIVSWVSGKVKAVKSLFQRKQHYELSETDL